MGCDIHATIEASDIYHDGRPYYMTQATVELDRYYAMFERFAGVRGDKSVAIVQPRGIPADASWKSREYASDIDLHSHSWLTYEEFKTAVESVNKHERTYAAALAYMKVLVDAGMIVRIVFAFDN